MLQQLQSEGRIYVIDNSAQGYTQPPQYEGPSATSGTSLLPPQQFEEAKKDATGQN